MPEQPSRLSAPAYARASGLDYGHVRRLAEQGKIPGAEKVGGKWSLPAPSDLGSRLSSEGGMIAGFGGRKKGDFFDVEKAVIERHGRFTKATFRAWARHAPENVIRSAERIVVVYDENGKKTYKTIVGPLARIKPETAIRRLRSRYGVGFAPS